MKRQSLPSVLMMIVCLAFMACRFSYGMRAETVHEMISESYATLGGEGACTPEFKSRILFPAALKLARLLAPKSVDDVDLWKGLRLLTALAAFGCCFACIKALTESSTRAIVACMFLEYTYLWTVTTHQWEHPTDFLDIAFTSIFALLAIRERYGWLLAVTLLASLNRESAAFSGLIVIGLAIAQHGISRAAARKGLIGVACIALAYGTVTVIRLYSLDATQIQQQVGLLTTLEHWRRALLPFGAGTAFLAIICPYLIAFRNLSGTESSNRRGLLLGCLGCLGVTLVFGIVFELRVLLPCFVLLIFALAMSAPDDSDQQWLARLFGARADDQPSSDLKPV
jgi:hypothetical protein